MQSFWITFALCGFYMFLPGSAGPGAGTSDRCDENLAVQKWEFDEIRKNSQRCWSHYLPGQQKSNSFSADGFGDWVLHCAI